METDYISQEKEKIISELLESKKVQEGQLINYPEFLCLYEPYKGRMSEQEFANILGINYSNYMTIRNKGTKTKVLKDKRVKLTEEIKEEIISELLESKQVQVGQSINYEQFLSLYKPYKYRMNEQEFSSILGISYSNYITIKNKVQKAKVLKDKRVKLTEEIKEEIISELLESKQVQVGQSINYEQFLSLYKPYKNKINEKEFAGILGISYNSYIYIKYQGKTTKILKDRKEKITEEEKQQIIRELLESNKAKVGQPINYAKFLSLYEPYKDRMGEQEFANILGIQYGNYISLKNKGTRAKILKDKKEKITEEEKEGIIQQLLESKKVQEGQLINYLEFLFLYELYKDRTSEQEFANILGISYSNYINMKNGGTRARILKDRKEKIAEEEKEKIVKELLENKHVQVGQSINYAEFLSLYEPYRDKISEQGFASLLGISYSNYSVIKYNKARVRILKDRKEKITEEEKEEIIKELLESNQVQVGQPINYEEFLYLYEPYRNKMSAQEFASLLGIANSHYKTIKNAGTRAKVLKDRKVKITEEEKQQIIRELLETNKVQVGQPINYAEFSSLYEPYKGRMDEQEFASLLDISYSNYMTIRNKGTKAKVLKVARKNSSQSPEECVQVLEYYVKMGLRREEALRRTREKLGLNDKELLSALEKWISNKKHEKEEITKKVPIEDYVIGE